MVKWQIIPIDLDRSWALLVSTIEPARDWTLPKIRHKRESSLC